MHSCQGPLSPGATRRAQVMSIVRWHPPSRSLCMGYESDLLLVCPSACMRVLLPFLVRPSHEQVLQVALFSGPPGGPKTTRAKGEPALSWFTFCRGGFGPASRPQNRGQNPVQFSCLKLVPHGVRCSAGRGVRFGRSARKGARMPCRRSTAPVAHPEPFARPTPSAPHSELPMGQYQLHQDCSAPGPTHRNGHTHIH